MNINKKFKVLSLSLIVAGSAFSFNTYSMNLADIMGAGKSPKYKTFKDAAKQGLNQSIAGNVKKMADTVLGVIPDAFKTSWIALSIYTNKFIFGTKPLDASRLNLMKEHTNQVLSLFISKGLRDLQSDKYENFLVKKEDVVYNLKHIISAFTKALLSYNYDQYRLHNPSVLNVKARFMALCSAFSLLDNDEISHHIINNIKYLNKIVEIVDNCETIEDAENSSADLNYWMNKVNEAFSQLNSLINLNSDSNRNQIDPNLLLKLLNSK